MINVFVVIFEINKFYVFYKFDVMNIVCCSLLEFLWFDKVFCLMELLLCYLEGEMLNSFEVYFVCCDSLEIYSLEEDIEEGCELKMNIGMLCI